MRRLKSSTAAGLQQKFSSCYKRCSILLLSIILNLELIAYFVNGLSANKRGESWISSICLASPETGTDETLNHSAARSDCPVNFNLSTMYHLKRRNFALGIASNLLAVCTMANADEGDVEPKSYENPNIPAGPEERSGLVILRVAEVAQFQEKLLRAISNGSITGTTITPQQIVFGTQILLRNSNISGNMQLMIRYEIPKKERTNASRCAAKAMNTIQLISTTAAKIQRPFTNEEMVEIADMYRNLRVQLNNMYEFLPRAEKDKYFGYFMAVTEYEKKIADGVYNPELDGVLSFDY